MTETERVLRDTIIELARMMVTHVDPRNVQTVIDRLLELDANDSDTGLDEDYVEKGAPF